MHVPEAYTGERTADALVAFVEDALRPATQAVTTLQEITAAVERALARGRCVLLGVCPIVMTSAVSMSLICNDDRYVLLSIAYENICFLVSHTLLCCASGMFTVDGKHTIEFSGVPGPA